MVWFIPKALRHSYANLQFCRFVQENNKKKKKKNERKVLFDGTPWRDCLLLSYQKSQVSKDSFQQIFHFWFERRPRNCAIVRHGPPDESEKKSWNFSSAIGSFGDRQQKIQYFWFCRRKLVVCSEITFSKNTYHMETSQLICFANRMPGFYMIQVFTERYFRTDINSKFLVILLSKSDLWQWLNMPSKVGLHRATRNSQ